MNINEKHYIAFKWCCDNNIRIYPKLKKGKYILVYEINGISKTSGKEYDVKYYMDAIWEFYLFLYNKLNNATS